MTPRIIVTDLDNTLLRRDKTISNYTIDVFNRCRDRGIKIAFATARPTAMVKEFVEMISTDAICVNNGSCIFIGNDPPIKLLFEQETQRSLLSDLSRCGSIYGISAQTGEEYYSTSADDDYKIQLDFSQETGLRFCLIAFHYRDLSEALQILQKYKGIHYYVVSAFDMVDIEPEGASKSNAVKTVADHMGIAISDIVAFGDDYNDIEMLRDCGVGVAVANAIDECKAVADYVCGDCDDDGVARWIEENVL